MASSNQDREAAQSGDDDGARLREAGRRLFAGPCTFVKGVTRADALPAGGRVEVAFAGRSNVGKSSLLNALTGRKNLARTSNTPGRTREINFFALDEAAYLVDLPGYGYAQAPKAKVAAWAELIVLYLRGRTALRRVFMLVDSRHGLKSADEEIAGLMDDAAVSYQVILTKTDKLKADERDNVLALTGAALAKHPAAHPQVLATSAVKGWGIAELQAEIVRLIEAG